MGWVEVTEPFAAPARPRQTEITSEWSGGLDESDGRAELIDCKISADELRVEGLRRLHIDGCHLDGTALHVSGVDEVHISGTRIERSDLSQARIARLEQTTVVGTKLMGTDFSGAEIEDVAFDNCVIRLANLRLATLKRVSFTDCEVADVDAYDAQLDDVGFHNCRIAALNIDRVKATRVDLRGAVHLELDNPSKLEGFLVAETQLPGLVYQLAQAAGLGIEAT